jgi:hypothetical protein
LYNKIPFFSLKRPHTFNILILGLAPHVYKLERWAIHLFLFCNWGSKEVLPVDGLPNGPKKIDDGRINMALSKKRKQL